MNEKDQQHIFENWLYSYKSLIFKVIRAYALTTMDQEDLFQEIAVQLWHSIPKFKQESSDITWIYRISLNTSIKWIRKERKHVHVKALDNVQHVLQESRPKLDERLGWLYEEIYSLNEIDRSITLLLLDNFSYKEMADILGITESNVGVKINRIKKYLISKSKKYDYHGI